MVGLTSHFALADASGSTGFTSLVDELHWGQHWFLTTHLFSQGSSDEAVIWARLRLLISFAVLYGLYRLLYLLARRVFNLDLLHLKTEAAPKAAISSNSDSPSYEYRLCATQSTYPVLPVGSPLQNPTLRLDCRGLTPITDKAPPAIPLSRQLRSRLGKCHTPIILEYFEHEPHNPSLTQAKIALINYLRLHTTCSLVITSKVHPTVFADCGHTRETCSDKQKHELIWQTGDCLLEALADFRVTYVPMVPTPSLHLYDCWPTAAYKKEREEFEHRLTAPMAAAPPSELVQHYVYLRWFVKVECSALPFLGSQMEEEFAGMLVRKYKAAQRISEDDIILRIQQRAQFCFRQLWDTLTPYEHYILYDVAQDGLVNSRDAQVINDLLQKGLLVYNQAGLRLVNESFRYFILNGLPPQQALRIEREAAEEADREGTWARRSLPIFLTLSAAALFIFVTQRSVLNEAQTFLTALTATLPLLYRFVSLTPFSFGSTASKAAAT
jgi:hypothetical protein